MRWPLREEDLPSGYRLAISETGPFGVVAFEASTAAALAAAGFGPAGEERLEPSEFSGRRRLGMIPAEPGSESAGQGARFLVRTFYHGGLFRWLGPCLYLDPLRPFRELALAGDLSAQGIPTPEVVAARARRLFGGFGGWRLDLVTRALEGCMDGAQALERLRRGELTCVQRAVLFRAAGRLVGRLHRAGFLHKDLHARNMLFERELSGEQAAWVIDLEGSRFLTAPMSAAPRRANLARAWRWLSRKERRLGRFTTLQDRGRFLASYRRAFDDGAEAHGWKADWRAIARRDRRAGWLHRAGWWIEKRLGVGHERHDGGHGVALNPPR